MKRTEKTLFDEYLTDYENELALFEETTFERFCELEEEGFTKVGDFAFSAAGVHENEAFVMLKSGSFTLLDHAGFCWLRF